ncbi:MAG: TlpA family protein disulfide reductase [Myxococcales bacterium]|nr:TlpA family protein disulfide reductase [Myxococcales bacterium]
MNYGPRRALQRIFIFGLAALFSVALTGSVSAVEKGHRAPKFAGPSLDGSGKLSFKEYEGQVVYVDFWASWCPPCLKSLPVLDELQKEFGPQGFQVLAVNVDKDVDAAREFFAERGASYPSLSDPKGQLPRQFGLETMPTSYLIDREGRVHWIHEGFKKKDVEKIRSEIKALLDASPSVPSTPSRPAKRAPKSARQMKQGVDR